MTTDLAVLKVRRGRFALVGMILGAVVGAALALLLGGSLSVAVGVGIGTGGLVGILAATLRQPSSTRAVVTSL